MTSFQSLGGFIATFADPSMTGLRLTADETVVYNERDVIISSERCLRLLVLKQWFHVQ